VIDLDQYRLANNIDALNKKFWGKVWDAFRTPINTYNQDDYAVTQYIAAYFLSKDYDGLYFTSAVDFPEKNLVLFKADTAVAFDDTQVFQCYKTELKFQNWSEHKHDNAPVLEVAKYEMETAKICNINHTKNSIFGVLKPE
jgi:hypothetical protein